MVRWLEPPMPLRSRKPSTASKLTRAPSPGETGPAATVPKGPRTYDWAAARLLVIDVFDGDRPTVSGGCRPAAARPDRTRSNTASTSTKSARYPGWYRHITLAMLAHAFLATVAAAEIERGAEETVTPPSRPSPWQRSGDSWTLSIPAQRATGIPIAH